MIAYLHTGRGTDSSPVEFAVGTVGSSPTLARRPPQQCNQFECLGSYSHLEQPQVPRRCPDLFQSFVQRQIVHFRSRTIPVILPTRTSLSFYSSTEKYGLNCSKITLFSASHHLHDVPIKEIRFVGENLLHYELELAAQ